MMMNLANLKTSFNLENPENLANHENPKYPDSIGNLENFENPRNPWTCRKSGKSENLIFTNFGKNEKCSLGSKNGFPEAQFQSS